MDAGAAEALIPTLKVQASLHIVEQAGHQLFLENPEQFNKIVFEAVTTNA